VKPVRRSFHCVPFRFFFSLCGGPSFTLGFLSHSFSPTAKKFYDGDKRDLFKNFSVKNVRGSNPQLKMYDEAGSLAEHLKYMQQKEKKKTKRKKGMEEGKNKWRDKKWWMACFSVCIV
jgi:hypothetical protein